MTVMDEEKMFKDLSESLPSMVNQILEDGDRATELLEKLAIDGVFVFNREDFFKMLVLYNKLETALSILLSIDLSEDNYSNVMKIIATTKTIKEIDKLFQHVHKTVDSFNNHVINQEFDFMKYELINRLRNILDFECVDYDDLEKAVDKNSIYLVMKVEDVFDNRAEVYGSFNTLRLKSFKTKTEANRYCLGNGISRDFIFCRYGWN